MLITAGDISSFNSLTASWGGIGKLWNWPVAFIFIRPQRYTYSFTESNSHFTLCFFEKKYKTALTYFGTHSGRDTDKAADAGLSPKETEYGNVYYQEAKLVIECEKIYFHDLDKENFLDSLIKRNYPNKDYHRMYVGKIVNCFLSDKNGVQK
jgi:flavin reductase (DIM6/NTAB) family NADH-FMN oxidoreductase RutF